MFYKPDVKCGVPVGYASASPYGSKDEYYDMEHPVPIDLFMALHEGKPNPNNFKYIDENGNWTDVPPAIKGAKKLYDDAWFYIINRMRMGLNNNVKPVVEENSDIEKWRAILEAPIPKETNNSYWKKKEKAAAICGKTLVKLD